MHQKQKQSKVSTFNQKYGKEANKSDYKCGLSVSFSLRFVFNISRKVRKIILVPKNVQHKGRPSVPLLMNFLKIPKGGGGSFPFQKILLQNF